MKTDFIFCVILENGLHLLHFVLGLAPLHTVVAHK